MSHDSPEEAGNIVDSRGRPISREVASELKTALLRINPPVMAERMWRRLFTEEDREKLGGELQTSWPRLGTVGLWVQARGVSVEQAVIDVARGLDVMSEQTARWLRRELGLESENAAAPSDRPIWRAETGELRLGDLVIRRVRVLRQPSNIQQILDAFQAAGWPSRIPNNLPYGQEQLHQALRSLNTSLQTIRFRAQQGGTAIIWERR